MQHVFKKNQNKNTSEYIKHKSKKKQTSQRHSLSPFFIAAKIAEQPKPETKLDKGKERENMNKQVKQKKRNQRKSPPSLEKIRKRLLPQ